MRSYERNSHRWFLVAVRLAPEAVCDCGHIVSDHYHSVRAIQFSCAGDVWRWGNRSGVRCSCHNVRLSRMAEEIVDQAIRRRTAEEVAVAFGLADPEEEIPF